MPSPIPLANPVASLGCDVCWLAIIVAVIGLAAIGGVIYFGTLLFRGLHARQLFGGPFMDHLFELWHKAGIRPNVPKYLSECYIEFLERRNEFWTIYSQVLVATLVIIVLTILLLSKTISAEAGLPILSGISGFAVAKGVSVGRASTTGSFDERERQ